MPIKVLIIEDSPVAANLLSALFPKLGNVVGEAKSPLTPL